ncbi:caspase, EACC1-associated type [Streptomyces sp. NRRL F-5123]|uniref:caspase, EACC1-associated type n=1 Tax=Streptomyces sp. NRRL F-5123 TaxID=1463856 RepID=UPI0006944F00|nr:PQQ-binding-like beta-propeller repeat protein [Streptomyces sp. NRRL F-5123]
MTALSDPATSRAVLIGAHDFQHLTNLPAVEHSLTTLAELLGHPLVWGLPAAHRPLLTQPPNAHTVIDVLEEAAAGATDTLVVYYAGHGLIDHHGDGLVLALPSSRPGRSDTALRFEDVRRTILDARVTARKKVVILDCCFSGLALSGEMAATAPSSRVADHALIEGTFLLTATAGGATALSPPGDKYTVFTGELIDVLAKGIPGAPPLLDMETIYRELRSRLSARGRPVPEQRNRNQGGLIALARNRAVDAGSTGPVLTGSAGSGQSDRVPQWLTRRSVLTAAGGLFAAGAGGLSWLALANGRNHTGDTAADSPSATPAQAAAPSPTPSRSASPSPDPTASPPASPSQTRPPVRRPPTKKWTVPIDDGANQRPVLVGNTLWVAGSLGKMTFLGTATGKSAGFFETGANTVLPQPAESGGVVYVGAQTGNQLFAIDGEKATSKWTFKAGGGVNSEPAVSDGLVFVTCFNGVLYAVNAASGREKWHYAFSSTAAFSCAAAQGRVFVTEGDVTGEYGPLRAVSARTGSLLWHGGTYEGRYAYPAVYGDTLLVSTWDVGLTAFDAATGHPRWTYSMKGPGDTGAVSLAGHSAYFSSPFGLHAVDARTGKERWKAGVATSGPVTLAEGVVYVGSSDSHLHGLDDATGHELWKVKLSGDVDAPLVADGAIYVISAGKYLTALDL